MTELVRWKKSRGKGFSQVHRINCKTKKTECNYGVPNNAQFYVHLHDSLDDLDKGEICQLCFPKGYNYTIKVVRWRKVNKQLTVIHEVRDDGMTRCDTTIPHDTKRLVKRLSYLNGPDRDWLCHFCFKDHLKSTG